MDFEYLINEVIRNDAAWATQFCSFSDYDVVILEVSKHTHRQRLGTPLQMKQQKYTTMYKLTSRKDILQSEIMCVFNVCQVCPETNTVMINIGLLLLAFSNSDEEHCRLFS